MNKSTRKYANKCLLLILCLALLAGHASAKATSSKDLLAELKKSWPQSSSASDQQVARYPDQLEVLLNQGRWAEVEQAMVQLKAVLPSGSERTSELIEQLLANIRTEMAEATAKQQAAYNAIATEFVTKFEAKAPAASFDSMLQRMAALPSAMAYNSTYAQKLETLRNYIARWQDYLMQSAAGNPQQALQSINELVQLAVRLPIIPRSQLAAVSQEVAARINSRNGMLDDKWDAGRKKLTETIDSAKSAADFDQLLIDTPKASGYGSNSGQGEILRRMVLRWQDYYSQLDAGNAPAAQNLLKELSNDPNIELYYPRSRILARLNPKIAASQNAKPPAESATLLQGPLVSPQELTGGNIDKLSQQLQARWTSGEPLAGLEDLRTELGFLRGATVQLKAGNPQAAIAQLRLVDSTPDRVGDYAEALGAVRSEIQMQVAPLYLEAPAGIQPAKQDSFESYCKKLMEHGRKQKDWALVYRVLLAGQNTLVGNFNSDPDLSGYKQFFAGLQQEEAGQWLLAARSYIGSLSAGAPNLPVEEIGRRLDRIKAEHPEDYAQAESPRYVLDPSSPGRLIDPRFIRASQNAAPIAPATTAIPKPPPQPANEPAPAK